MHCGALVLEMNVSFGVRIEGHVDHHGRTQATLRIAATRGPKRAPVNYEMAMDGLMERMGWDGVLLLTGEAGPRT